MEGVLLSILGGERTRISRPRMELADLDARTRYLQVNSIERSTAKGYATGARDYINFCLKHSLSLDPTPQTLSRYIAYTSQFISSGAKYLTGARHFLADLYPDFERNRAHPIVQATIAGAKKIRADPVRRKLPLRPSHLEAFRCVALRTGTYDDLLFAVLLSCCFYACHRSGELVWQNQKDLQDWRKVIKRASLHFSHGRAGYCLPYQVIKRASLHFSHGRAGYCLPYHKADRFYRGTDILFTHQDVADPVTLLQEYTRRRDARHGGKTALFLREDGTIPTRSWFDNKFFALLDRQFGGHSARAGGATFYASLGLTEDVIQALGRWSSQAWKDYIHDNPTIRAELQLAILQLRIHS
jgi:hypothetical protein